MASHSGSKIVVYAALAGNLLIAVTKFIAAAFTGSSAMLSEGVHSLVDTGNELLLLHGMKRASIRPDRVHPFGHGRELYFWSFIVALLVFALGAGVSFFEGILHVLKPVEIRNVTVNYIVLGLSIFFEGSSWLLALRSFRRTKGKLGYLAAVHRSKDPTVFSILFEDSAALLGIAIALSGITASVLTGNFIFDGIASLGIAAILAVTAIFLARECKGLLLGEAALPEVQKAIFDIVSSDPDVQKVNGIITQQLGPNQVVANVSLEFEDRLTAPQIEECILRIEKNLAAARPEVVGFFVKPQTAGIWARRGQKIEANHEDNNDINEE
ncbi:cation diffusion facilitator family transporter [uncultured Bartonella sp.]|uniref:cation diffusion facilitator family transporter n=1 Tax=uncultured Bartonella sp. TaxID=104108 RepID=UPI00260C1F96|nr:cation diffusion facilitator family transporter [uncultured Bartonella sp.]